MANRNIGINFANLSEKWDLFPFSCTNGYYFLWNIRLPAPSLEEVQQKPAELLRKAIKRIKGQARG